MRKKDLALEVIDRLKKCYPESDCTLDYNEAWKLLISVRLAAQCTDERVNKIVPKLYEKFPDIESLANADISEITEIVKPCGLGNSKARDISLCMKMLRDKYDCKVPDDFDEREIVLFRKKRMKKCKSYYGRCFWKTCYCYRYTLHPSMQQNWSCR